MALLLIKPGDLPAAASVDTDAAVMVQNGDAVERATPQQVVDAGRPIASEAQAVTGTDNTTAMTPLTTRQAINADTTGSVALAVAAAEAAEASALDAESAEEQTGLDALATAADRVQTGLDVVATAADRVQTGLDVAATAADAVATAADRVQTGLDVAATNADAVATAADRVQTGLDATATAADRVQTGLDLVAVEAAVASIPNALATRTALKALDTTEVTAAYLKEAGREGQFIWRTGNFSAEVAADTSEGIYLEADAVAATSGAWVRVYQGAVSPLWFGAVADGVTDDVGAFNAALTLSSVHAPEGFYQINGTIEIDNSTMPGETESGPGGTVLTGQDARLTILQAEDNATVPLMDITYGTGAQAHAYHRFEKFSLIALNGDNGMQITNAAFLRMSDITVRGFDNGILATSVLSSSFRDMRIDSNVIGVNAEKGAGFSYTNAVKFDACIFSNNSQLGIGIGDACHNVQIVGGSFEGNGTQGVAGSGGLTLTFDGGVEGAVGAVIDGVYFEGNGGGHDIRLENTDTAYVTVVIKGCNFNRISNTKYVTNNILAIGNINLILIGNAFRGFGTYVQDAGRQYVSRSASVRLTAIGNMYESGSIEAVGMFARGNLEKARGSVSAAGAALNLPDGWTVTNTGAGVYRVTHNLGLAPALYSVVATASGASIRSVQRVAKDAGGNFFDVVTVDAAASLTNSDFDFVVMAG